MRVRWPLVPEDSVPNRFGWRHEGPGPQWPQTWDRAETLLPGECFDHETLKKPPQYVPERQGGKTFGFMLDKGCAGLAYECRTDAGGLHARIASRTMVESDTVPARWMLSGLQTDEDFVRLHTMGRLSIASLAYLVREAFGETRAPWRQWLNQWGRDPGKPLPTLPGDVRLESADDLVGLHVDDIALDDERRIDESGITYVKLNGHLYWLRRNGQ